MIVLVVVHRSSLVMGLFDWTIPSSFEEIDDEHDDEDDHDDDHDHEDDREHDWKKSDDRNDFLTLPSEET